jgi:hypothetical protein
VIDLIQLILEVHEVLRVKLEKKEKLAILVNKVKTEMTVLFSVQQWRIQ